MKQHLQEWKLKKYEKTFGWRALKDTDDEPSFFDELAPSKKSPAAWEVISTLDLVNKVINSFNN